MARRWLDLVTQGVTIPKIKDELTIISETGAGDRVPGANGSFLEAESDYSATSSRPASLSCVADLCVCAASLWSS